MNGEGLQKNLGNIVANVLKPSKQCVSAVKKANMTLGKIKHHIVSWMRTPLSDFTKAFRAIKVRILHTSMESAINQRYSFIRTSSTQSNQVDS